MASNNTKNEHLESLSKKLPQLSVNRLPSSNSSSNFQFAKKCILHYRLVVQNGAISANFHIICCTFPHNCVVRKSFPTTIQFVRTCKIRVGFPNSVILSACTGSKMKTSSIAYLTEFRTIYLLFQSFSSSESSSHSTAVSKCSSRICKFTRSS